jgi:orotidine-5'-phosphate decarboxylase
MSSIQKNIIVALDFDTLEQTLAFLKNLDPKLCRVKVGKALFTAAGPLGIDAIHALGFDVFLDLKFHDIPNTVAHACKQAAKLGVWMLTIHTLGGLKMLESARNAVDACDHKPLIMGVTWLTSTSVQDLKFLGLNIDLLEHVHLLAGLANQTRLDGVIASAQEALMLKNSFPDLLIASPGIRLAHHQTDDQVRTATPAQALAAGVDYLVVGRPITHAPFPDKALADMLRFC